MELIIKIGAVAGAISAIIALILTVMRFIHFIKAVVDKLDAIIDDIADLQYERLSQAHDFYMDRGWCPTSKKVQLCNMYKSYTAKGRNHLSKHYENDLLGLPDKPPESM